VKKLLLAMGLLTFVLGACSEQESTPEPANPQTQVQQTDVQKQLEKQRQEEDDAATDAAVQTSVDMMMSVAAN
jgi:PBP1b-binding outer membrane lipoprotein LpoB